MTSLAEVMQMHAAALFTLDASGRLHSVNEPWATPATRRPAPRFYLLRGSAANIWRFHHGLAISVASELEALCRQEPLLVSSDASRHPLPRLVDAYLRALQCDASGGSVWSGPAYYLPRGVAGGTNAVVITAANAWLLAPHFADLQEEIATAQPFVAAVRHGRAVSVCRSVRVTHHSTLRATEGAHAAGVETAAAYRGLGIAVNVVSAWAQAVYELGGVPLYSTSSDNAASQRVATKLGAVWIGMDFHVS